MLKIGCFGSVVALHPKGDKCASCPLLKTCFKAVQEKEAAALALIEKSETKQEKGSLFKTEHHDINDIPDAAYHKIKRYFARRAKMMTSSGKPKRTRDQAEYESMVKSGVKFPQISTGKNPFSGVENYEYMKHAVDCLLEYKNLKAADISEYYGEVGFGKTAGTRKTLASRALKVLTLAEVIKTEDGVYCLA